MKSKNLGRYLQQEVGTSFEKRGNYYETISLAQVPIVSFFPIYRRAAIFVSFINEEYNREIQQSAENKLLHISL